MTRILVVDDEPQILRALRINLVARRYEVAVATDGASALREAADWHPDLVVLDLGLPDIDGIDVIHGLRGWTSIPIVVLSGRASGADKVDALDAGADDYVTKPFGIDELLARIRAVTRRSVFHEAELASIRVGDHVVDLTRKSISGEVRLTPTEWQLLEILLRNPGKLISQRQLLTEVWGVNYVKESHYLRQYMAQLRKKLEPDPAHPVHLLTEPGMGYRFQS
ncbi:response regulator [Streptosporangium sp. NBC_01755]|uniref:response regulator n=1 Tax=unclassified Streptosporangium TaxID=2632669 RepID=UPI002DDC2274|nr:MULTISPECIES: response regulator [unclassified Streptosporangium]WSA29409.1 response regulator [Streptosporangium sp. NBC_01810]WSC99147.1 response regulator [Streptosporangium sp. NBC_01755]